VSVHVARAERALIIAAREKAPLSILRIYAAAYGNCISLSKLPAEATTLLHTCESCTDPAVHGEWHFGKSRFWCVEHTPMSGHWEHCGTPCEALCCGDLP